MSLDMELMINDEELEQVLKKYSKDLADQRQRVDDVFSQLSYEKNIIVQSQTIINRALAAEAEYDEKMQEVLLVCCQPYCFKLLHSWFFLLFILKTD